MRLGYFLVWLGTLMLVATTCQAQPSRGGNRGRNRSSRDTLFRLLDIPAVRDELGVRRIQVKMLTDLQADLSEQRRAALSSVPSATPGRPVPGTPGDRFDAMRDAVQKIRGQGEKLIAVILDTDQAERLNQLRVQDEGTRALDRKEIRAQLEVTTEQIAKIQALRRATGDTALSRRRQEQKLDQDVLAVLSKEQREKFEDLKGEAFKFPLVLPADLRGLRVPGKRPSGPGE